MIRYDIAGYLIFAFVTSVTPGPNNFLLFAYGKKYGFRDSSRLMMGIALGFITMLFMAGYGMTEIISRSNTIGLVLKVISSVWLFYLAVLLSKINSDVSGECSAKVSFYQAFLMQFVNPKAWIMAVTGATAFLPQLSNIHISVLVFALSFAIIGAPSMFLWISFGDWISRVLKSKKANRNLGYILFVLMVASIVMIWV
jgi:threonine/homoserine/homoserine lactone efflux protein